MGSGSSLRWSWRSRGWRHGLPFADESIEEIGGPESDWLRRRCQKSGMTAPSRPCLNVLRCYGIRRDGDRFCVREPQRVYLGKPARKFTIYGGGVARPLAAAQ